VVAALIVTAARQINEPAISNFNGRILQEIKCLQGWSVGAMRKFPDFFGLKSKFLNGNAVYRYVG
jgi:hypothetical protein